MGRASARDWGAIAACARAAAAAAGAMPAARRLLARVLRFCAKGLRTKGRKLASSRPSSTKRGANLQRKTVEYTSGGGEKDSGGKVKSFSAGPYICTVTESRDRKSV